MQRRKRESPLGALGVLVLLGMIATTAVSVGAPVVAPQATCDLLAPILGCEDGAAPSCYLVQSGRKGQNVRVVCPEGGGSAAPIYIVAIAVSLLVFAFGLPFLILRARRRRREARPVIRSW